MKNKRLLQFFVTYAYYLIGVSRYFFHANCRRTTTCKGSRRL